MNTQAPASRHVLTTLRNAVKRLFAREANTGGGDLLQLYLLARGSDSVRPAVIRKLRAAGRN